MVEQIANYWDKQSVIWREEKVEAWSKPETENWLTFLKKIKTETKAIKVLEIGTASGYFANILQLAGFDVTAIDLSPKMINEAKNVSNSLGISVEYHVMDAQKLNFDITSFDFVFTRLMTWTIPDVEKFYSQVFRVLRKGGLFINIDGDFGKCEFSQDGHEKYSEEIMQEANAIKAQLKVNSYNRPQQDIELLKKVGFLAVSAENEPTVYGKGAVESDSGLFLLRATK